MILLILLLHTPLDIAMVAVVCSAKLQEMDCVGYNQKSRPFLCMHIACAVRKKLSFRVQSCARPTYIVDAFIID